MDCALKVFAAALAGCIGGSALAVWGVKYEVNAGAGWTTAATVDVSSGPKSVDFRISVYHDGAEHLLPGLGSNLTAWAPLRLCNSQRVTNFGNPLFGDGLVSFNLAVSVSNAKALVHSQAGSDLILGTPNSIYSFASDTALGAINPRPQKLETQYYAGKLLIGNSGAAAKARTITLTANTFAYPNAGIGTGGAFGASFYASSTSSNWGVATEASTTIPAVITVAAPCPGDLNSDGVVDDADFTLFTLAHDLLDCADPSMPAGCLADLNWDGLVDDADFLIFAAAYDAIVCP